MSQEWRLLKRIVSSWSVKGVPQEPQSTASSSNPSRKSWFNYQLTRILTVVTHDNNILYRITLGKSLNKKQQQTQILQRKGFDFHIIIFKMLSFQQIYVIYKEKKMASMQRKVSSKQSFRVPEAVLTRQRSEISYYNYVQITEGNHVYRAHRNHESKEHVINKEMKIIKKKRTGWKFWNWRI